MSARPAEASPALSPTKLGPVPALHRLGGAAYSTESDAAAPAVAPVRHRAGVQEIWTRREVLAYCGGRAAVEEALRAGSLIRIRRDRYCSPAVPPEVMVAIAGGGVLSCVTLLVLGGVWVTRPSGVHVQRPPHGRTPPTTATVHAVDSVCAGSLGRASMLDAVLLALDCQSLVDAIAALDSALHLGIVRRSDLIPHCLDAQRLRILGLADARAESGIESIVRVALVLAGLRVEVQVSLAGVGRVDLLVEGCVVVEVDGKEFHRGPRLHVDHQRDAATLALGLTPLRFDWAQVVGELPAVVDAVIGAVAAHRAGFDRRDADVATRRAVAVLPRITSVPR